MKTGRPLKFKTVKELEEKGMAFFKLCEDEDIPPTITGLALHLDTTRETLMDYQARDEFSDTVKKLKLICENFAEQRLFTARNPAGPIFALKNYGWKDRHEIGGPDGEPIPMKLDLKNASVDELLKLLTAKSGNSGRRRK